MGNVQYMVGHGDADNGGNVDIVIEKDKKRRMPLKFQAWEESDVKVLRDFVYDLDAKQRR